MLMIRCLPVFLSILVMVLAMPLPSRAAEESDPLLDFSAWKKYRAAVAHPSLAVKPADLARARENARRYDWARRYVDSVVRSAEAELKRLGSEKNFIETMIPETTPGDALFTPCPACRDLKKPAHPHGEWDWSPQRPDELKCHVCGTVFPNDKYPESIALQARWGHPQTLTFCGGEPFVIFGYKTGRPSFTGNIRARKVAYITGVARQLGEAYALTGRVEFAQATRPILLRLAKVYPHYLVHEGYGEYADMDPRVAAFHINELPSDELCYPPNKPDRVLHTGYWSAGRASGVGSEGRRLQSWVEAYDFTCTARLPGGRSVYSDDDRMTIERDLLLEATILLVADKQINNKSVGNRSAAAEVGMCLGHPGLVRFGLEGFYKAVNDWFLPDGFTPESPAYAQMTLGGIDEAGQALRGYSDPRGYRDEAGERIDRYDPFNDPKSSYGKVWQGQYDSMQGDLSYPPFADSYVKTKMTPRFAELMVAGYPRDGQYLSVLAELCGKTLDKDISASTALYYRAPGLEARVGSAPPIVLRDVCPPELRIGFMRTGERGRDSLLLLNASHWGSHHHLDSLNLYYWKEGRELLSDLGYLWDHPDKHMTSRTLAHNTVLIDEAEQVSNGRGGEVEFFVSDKHVKAMRASSNAYASATAYQRTSALIDHGAAGSYAVDVFFAAGGKKRDYVFHGPVKTCRVDGASLSEWDQPLYDLEPGRRVTSDGAWSIQWTIDDAMRFVAWNVPQAGETAVVADGWGQRDYKNSDLGAKLPYIVRRTEGQAPSAFASVFEGIAGSQASLVRSVQRLDMGPEHAGDAVGLMVETPLGRDYILCLQKPQSLEIKTADGPLKAEGSLLIRSVDHRGHEDWKFSN